MIVFALFLSWSKGAEAIPLLSGDGTETCSLGPLLGGGVCSVQAITPHPLWQPAHPAGSPAVWVSYNETGYGGTTLAPWDFTNPIMTITETFLAGTGSTLHLDVWADDTARIRIDGTEVFAPNFSQNICADGAIGCEPGELGTIAYTFTSLGVHTVALDVYQIGTGTTPSANPFGFLYTGEVNTSPVPEPATYLLFATGLLGLLGYGWRRKQAV
jgi:PEP-CTERM motif